MTTFQCLFISFLSIVCPVDCLWFDDSLQETDEHYVLERQVLTNARLVLNRAGLQTRS